MLIFQNTKYIKAPFDTELELEKVIIDNYEYLFGPSSIFLPKALIKTADGVGTIPDGFAIDISQHKWYLVEAELIHHSVWSHIAPQITKQLLASQQPLTKKILEDLAVKQYQELESTKEKFSELDISEINVRKIIGEILDTEPLIGVPIDGVTNDLKEWARTLRYQVKLWLVNKYVEFNNPDNIIYEFPEEFRPELDTSSDDEDNNELSEITRYDVGIIDLLTEKLLQVGERLSMSYKPRNGQQTIYEALVLDDGSLQLSDQVYSSPSYAALAGIQQSGSNRQTVNGWTAWKNNKNETLAELRDKYLEEPK